MKQPAPDTIVVAGDILASPFSPPTHRPKQLRCCDASPCRRFHGNTDRYLLDWGTPRWLYTRWMRLRRSDPASGWLDEMATVPALIPPADLAW